MTELDQEFDTSAASIETLTSKLTSRHEVVRVNQWMDKMRQVMPNISWKRNRNQYALMLESMLRSGDLVDPFHKLPPNVGPLPTLPAHFRSRSPPKLVAEPSSYGGASTPDALRGIESARQRFEASANRKRQRAVRSQRQMQREQQQVIGMYSAVRVDTDEDARQKLHRHDQCFGIEGSGSPPNGAPEQLLSYEQSPTVSNPPHPTRRSRGSKSRVLRFDDVEAADKRARQGAGAGGQQQHSSAGEVPGVPGWQADSSSLTHNAVRRVADIESQVQNKLREQQLQFERAQRMMQADYNSSQQDEANAHFRTAFGRWEAAQSTGGAPVDASELKAAVVMRAGTIAALEVPALVQQRRAEWGWQVQMRSATGGRVLEFDQQLQVLPECAAAAVATHCWLNALLLRQPTAVGSQEQRL